MTLELMLTYDRFHSVVIKINGVSLAGSLKMPHRQIRKYNNVYCRKGSIGLGTRCYGQVGRAY